MSTTRTQERVIDPAGNGIRWFKLYENLAAESSALAWPCKWDHVNSKWIVNNTATRRRIYSTAPAITASESDFVPCWFSTWGQKWEVVRPPTRETNPNVVLYKLTATKELGASANAVLRTFNGVTYVDGAAIVVYDPLNKWAGISNFEGFAKKRETNTGATDEYDIIDQEQYARVIGFTISNSTGGLMKAANDQMLATVDYIEDGITPPVNGSSEILVHDDQEICPNAIAGASGWAIRNDYLGSAASPYYHIQACNQMCRQARAVLAQTMEGFNNFEVAITGFFPDDESPEGLDAIEPFKSRAFNPHGRRAPNGAQLRLRWGSAKSKDDPFGIPRQGYIIEDVERNGLRLPVNFRLNSSTKAIEMQKCLLAVETTQTEISNLPWEQMFPSGDC